MTLISLTDASKDFGIRSLFKNLNLHINEKERLGLIGNNGAGKSTLLKILSGLEPLGSGERFCSSKIRISFVSQEIEFESDQSVIEKVLSGCGKKRELLLRFSELSEEVAKKPNNPKLLKNLGNICEEMDNEEAWSLERECQEILNRLGIKDLREKVSSLSGGYRKRVGLASALVSNPDLLLLDEPTNHLDANTVEWLQNWLSNFQGALVLITHDRYVLDRVTNKMIELAPEETRIYNGNYTNFLENKSIADELQTSKAKKLRGVIRRELQWLRQGPKARSTKQKARLKRIEGLISKDKRGKDIELEMSTNFRRLGKRVIEAESIQLTTNGEVTGSNLLKNFSYSFSAEDRVGIIGSNGTGKSTLLDVIAGRKDPTNGRLLIGDTVHIGYLDQHTDSLNYGRGLNRKVIEFVEEAASKINLKGKQLSASQLLERFLFPPAQQHSPISKLSGGERRRLSLCQILIQSPNVLLLDEPTNDLDIESLSILEEFLEEFNGCVIIVSHDRYFLDRTVDRIFSFDAGILKRFEGNYSSYIEKERKEKLNLLNPNKELTSKLNDKRKILSLAKATHKERPRRRSFKESQELKELDKKIPALERERIILEESLKHGGKNLVTISKQLAEILETIKIAEDRWIELSEMSP